MELTWHTVGSSTRLVMGVCMCSFVFDCVPRDSRKTQDQGKESLEEKCETRSGFSFAFHECWFQVLATGITVRYCKQSTKASHVTGQHIWTEHKKLLVNRERE